MTARPMSEIPAILEAEFQEQVIDLAHICGWDHLHVRRSIGKGNRWVTATNVAWPDLTLWTARHGGRLIVRELKKDDGVVSPDQEAVLASLCAAGVDAAVWRPRDFDEIQHTLQTGETPFGAMS